MWQWVKIPKGIALAAFFLPWTTISCSNQKIASASGWNLLTGDLTVTNPMTGATQAQSGDANMLLVIAAVAILVGLIVSIIATRRRAVVVLGTSLSALACIWLATDAMTSEAIARKAAAEGGERFDAAIAAMIRVEWHIGYWVVMLALAAAVVMSAMTLSGRSLSLDLRDERVPPG